MGTPVGYGPGLAGGEDDGDGSPGGRRRRDHGGKGAVSDGGEEGEQVGVKERENNLGFRIAEAGVELDHLGAIGRQDQPGVEDAPKGERPGRPSP